MKKVLLVRHAESEANKSVDVKTTNVREISLTDFGMIQAGELPKSLPKSSDKVIVSSYIRTKQTATPYIASLENPSVEEWEVHEFTYLDSSKYDGTTTSERRSAVDSYWERNDPDYQDADNAESFQGLVDRVLRIREKISSSPGEVFVIFSHGYFIRVFVMVHEHLSGNGVVTKEYIKRLMQDVAPLSQNQKKQILNASVHEVLL